MAVGLARMATSAGKTIQGKRAATVFSVSTRKAAIVACSSSGCESRRKVKCAMRIFALVHDLMRVAALAPELLGLEAGTSAVPGLLASE